MRGWELGGGGVDGRRKTKRLKSWIWLDFGWIFGAEKRALVVFGWILIGLGLDRAVF